MRRVELTPLIAPAAAGFAAGISAAIRTFGKRGLIHLGFNLGLLMRHLTGFGTPRGLQGRLAAILAVLLMLNRAFWEPVRRHERPDTIPFTT